MSPPLPPAAQKNKRSPNKKKKTSSKNINNKQPNILTTSAPNEVDLFETLGHYGYMTEIFPLLEKVMECHRDKIHYHILGTDIVFESEEDLRQYLCIHGIPRAHLLDQDEFETLSLWACYAQVLPSDFTSKYPEMSQDDIQTILQTKLKLVQNSNNNATGSFTRGGNARHDKEEWETLEDVRVFLRGYGLAAMNRFDVRKLTPAEKANIRVWAARSSRPLPDHHETIHMTAKEGSSVDERNGGGGRGGAGRAKKQETASSVRRAQIADGSSTNKRSFLFPSLWSSGQPEEKEEEDNRPSKKTRTAAPDQQQQQPTSWFSSIRNMFSSSSKSDT